MTLGGQLARTFSMSLELVYARDDFKRNMGFGGTCLNLMLHFGQTGLCSSLDDLLGVTRIFLCTDL